MRILIFTFFLTQSLFGQGALDSVFKWTKIYNLLSLSQVDTTSKKLPQNIVTPSGWHIDYYAKNDIYNRIILYTFIYNDSIEHDFSETKFFNHGQITYDSVNVFRESAAFLYLKYTNTFDTIKDIVIIPKNRATEFYQFSQLIYADYENNVFIEYDNKCCEGLNLLCLKATNINNNKTKEIKFQKGICEGDKDKWCIDKITYANHTLTVTANLIDKKTKKQFTEIQKIEL